MKKYLKTLAKPNPYVALALLAISSYFIASAFLTGSADELAQQNIYRGEVLEILSEERHEPDPVRGNTIEQKLLVEIVQNEKKTVEALNDFIPAKKGDKVYVQLPSFQGENEEDFVYLVDIYRTRGILWLTLLFVALVGLVSGRKGFYALIGLMFSFVVIFKFLVPRLLSGGDPVTYGVISAVLILVVAIYVTYGYNKKSLAALLGIIVALIFTGLLSTYVVGWLDFSGFGGEESVYLNSQTRGTLNLVGLLTAGILIAIVGILDDIAVTQSAAVFSLASVDEKLKGLKLFRKAMEVGRDHISAVINTLVLAYTGAALPLLLLLTLNNFPLSFVINGELVAGEIVRALISSIGMILAVPLTTWFAVILVKQAK